MRVRAPAGCVRGALACDLLLAVAVQASLLAGEVALEQAIAFPRAYEVVVTAAGSSAAPATAGDDATLTAPSGRRLRCHLPRATDAAQATRDRASLRLARTATAVAAALHGHPLVKSFGYWSYEVRPAESVRQLRTASQADTAPAAPGAAPAPSPTQQHDLGVYVVDADELRVLPSGVVTFVQHYRGGVDGRQTLVHYTCDVPAAASSSLAADILSVEEVRLHEYHVTVGVRAPAVCSLLVSPRQLLASGNGSCSVLTTGWWSFEICLGKQIVQFHKGNNDVTEQHNTLGVYDWAAGETIDTDTLGQPPAIVQHYTSGSPCDLLNGAPRRATVRFECAAGFGGGAANDSPLHAAMRSESGGGGGGSLVLQSMSEPSSCVYRFVVASSAGGFARSAGWWREWGRGMLHPLLGPVTATVACTSVRSV
jgi:hypothetical protein